MFSPLKYDWVNDIPTDKNNYIQNKTADAMKRAPSGNVNRNQSVYAVILWLRRKQGEGRGMFLVMIYGRFWSTDSRNEDKLFKEQKRPMT